MNSENILVDAKTMAKITSIPLSSIWRGCREGTIPHYRYGRLVRFNLSEVLTSLRETAMAGGRRE